MNLADIRKKANQEQKQQPAAPEPVETKQEDNFPDILPEVAESEADAEVWYEKRQPSIQPPIQPPIARPDINWRHYDPLQTLLEGRELAATAEESVVTTAAAIQHDSADFVEFLYFRVASEKYAITIMEIKEIIKPREVTEVPRVPEFIPGVLSLRGVIIPVFNMLKRLGLPESGRVTGKERIIVVKKGEDFCGVLVDEVIQVVRIEAASIEPPPAVLDGIDREFVSGIGRNDSQMLILLNMDKILDVTLC